MDQRDGSTGVLRCHPGRKAVSGQPEEALLVTESEAIYESGRIGKPVFFDEQCFD